MDEERCYICNRTEEEVDELLYSGHFDDADFSSIKSMETDNGETVAICALCEGAIRTVSRCDLLRFDWLDEYVTERTLDILSEIINALKSKEKELTKAQK